MPRTTPHGVPTEEQLLACKLSELRQRALLLGIAQGELDRTTDAEQGDYIGVGGEVIFSPPRLGNKLHKGC